MENKFLSPVVLESSDKAKYEEGLKRYLALLPKLDKLYGEKSMDILSLEISQEIDFYSSLIETFDPIDKGSMQKDLLITLRDTVNELKSLEDSIRKPFLLFVVGMGNYGKSTLVNALLGHKLADVGVLPKTWKIDIFVKADNNSDETTLELVFKDSNREVMKETSARKYLADEERKRERSELEAARIFDAHSTEMVSIEAKEEYKAYLEKTMIYQSPVEEVIWHVQANGTILDEFRLVDTPGLIQDLLGDSKNGLSEYYFKADGVIWLLDATTISSKKSQELIMNIIQKSGDEEGHQNAIAVLNRIDQVHSQQREGAADRVLEQAREIYGKVFPKIIPFSAKQAWLGVSTQNQDLIAQSNIDKLRFHINEIFSTQARIVRYKSKTNAIKLLDDRAITYINLYLMRLRADIKKREADRQNLRLEAYDLQDTLTERYLNNMEQYRKQVVNRMKSNINNLSTANLIDNEGKYISTYILENNNLSTYYGNIGSDLEASIRSFYEYQIKKITFCEFSLIPHNFVDPLILDLNMPSIVIGDTCIDNTAINAVSAGTIGAAIGSLFFPGLGTVLGAVIGGIVGSSLSEPQDVKLHKLHAKVQVETDKTINEVLKQILMRVESSFKFVIDKLEQEQLASFAKLHCKLLNEAHVTKLLTEFVNRTHNKGYTASQMSMLIAIASPKIINKLSKD